MLIVLLFTCISVASSLQCNHLGEVPIGYCWIGDNPHISFGTELQCVKDDTTNSWSVYLVVYANDCNGAAQGRLPIVAQCKESDGCYCSDEGDICPQNQVVMADAFSDTSCSNLIHQEIGIVNECVDPYFYNTTKYDITRIIIKATSTQVIAFGYDTDDCSGNAKSIDILLDSNNLESTNYGCLDIICDTCDAYTTFIDLIENGEISVSSDSVPNGEIIHSYPGQYQQLTDDCSFDFPHGAGTDMSVRDGLSLGIDMIRGILITLAPINPAFGIISGILLMGKDGITGLLFDEQDPFEQVYGTMADMFNTLWDCTETYVQTFVQQAIWEQKLSSIRDDIDILINAIGRLSNKDNDEERWNAFDSNDDDIHGEINDMVDEFPLSETDSSVCRALMPLITEAMTIKIMAYYTYYQLGQNYSTDYHGSASDLPKASVFRVENVRLMRLYINCAHHAYHDILEESLSLDITQIQQEIELIFNAGSFCSWIEFTHLLGDMDDHQNEDPYDFAFDDITNYYDFTVFSDCNQKMLETFIINNFNNAYNADLVNTMRVSDYYSNTGIGDDYLLFKQIDLNDHVTFPSSAGCDSTSTSCSDTAIMSDMNNGNKYYFGNVDGRNTIRTASCSSNCDNNWWSKYNKISTCDDNDKFDLFSRDKSGVRYIIEYDSRNQNPLIVGYEFLCTNTDYYNGWHTDHVFANGINTNSNRYDWSPWFICPKGKTISIKNVLGINGCEAEQFLRNPQTIQCGQTACYRADCWRRYIFEVDNDFGIQFECI